jgi:pimeloyl-ACP methyl ester carboxylesterase
MRAVTCATLTVPLDHAGQVGGALQLRVGIDKVRRAPRGVLLFLTGGPGQPGVSFLPLLRSVLGSAFNGYRLVMLDQRGTGGGALRCPALQRAVGSSDLAVPPRGAVAACARTIGSKRRYFTTPETVADIDALRVALGARRLTLDGISYGTFVAERYALRYPTRVARLVLDSVVPQQGVDPLLLDAYNATAHVLRMACAEEHCGYDPARALHAVVRALHDGPRLLNAIVSESAGRASFTKALSALHAAERGQRNALDALIRQQERASAATAGELSQGLHESTVCLDLPPPSNPAASRAQRAAAIARRLARVRPAALYPFDRATATGNGLLVGCLEWPATIPPRLGYGNPAAKLPPVPVLLLAGGHDLSTPVAWARQEAAKAPRGRLVVLAGSGHSVQTGSRAASARRVVQRFLHG